MPTDFDTFLRAVAAADDRENILDGDSILDRPNPDYGYDATPRNALTFATMGVDGVRYAVLTTNGVVSDDSPVSHIGPMDVSEPYVAFGESVLDYLAGGCGVRLAEMAAVLDAERTHGNRSVPFLRERFERARLYAEARTTALARYLRRIESKA